MVVRTSPALSVISLANLKIVTFNPPSMSVDSIAHLEKKIGLFVSNFFSRKKKKEHT